MTDTTKLVEQQTQGDEAKRLQDNPLLQQFFELAKSEIVKQWEQCPLEDLEGQRNMKIALILQDNFKKQFTHFIVTGQVASHELLKMKDPTQFYQR